MFNPRMLNRLYIYRSLLTSLHDACVAGFSVWLSMFLRLGDRVAEPQYLQLLMIAVPLFVAISLVTFTLFGMYRGVWRYASVPDLVTIVKASTLAVLVFLPFLFLMTRLDSLPRTVPPIQWLLLITMLGGSRLIYRAIRSKQWVLTEAQTIAVMPVLVYGSGDEAEQFIRAAKRRGMYRPVGILDEKRSRHGRTIHGVKVMGGISSLSRALQKLKNRNIQPQKIIIADKSVLELKSSLIQKLSERAAKHGLSVARLPKLTEMQSLHADTPIPIQPIAIEDLLGRPQQVMNKSAIENMLRGKRVLITGAGGSIGSEITLQVAGFKPGALCILDNSEHNLYQIDRCLHDEGADFTWQPFLADVRDAARLDAIFAAFKPDVVFHAAAYKHVPMVEANPTEGALTNVIGSRNVANASLKAGAQAMVQISTDKAVNPTNIMGATKKLAEMMCQALDKESNGKTRFMTVRFGNVLGSSGSVVPLFRKQIERGGPITVTDPKIERYFMMIPEAVGLVLSASAYGLTASERGRIFVLDMGEPIRIDDLARHMIRLAGLEPEKDIQISYVGLRPGEKLYEELFNDGEAPLPTDLPNIRAAAPDFQPLKKLDAVLKKIEEAAHQNKAEGIHAVLEDIVPNYKLYQAAA